MVANVVTKFEWTPVKLVGEIENSSCTWFCVKEISKCHNFLEFLGDNQKKNGSLYDYDTLYKVWMNQMKIGSGAEF